MATAKKDDKEDWMQKKWRPAMGWMYMGVCTFDFMLAPVLWSVMQSLLHGNVSSQWQPLTLQGAGLFHLAMGAVLGIAAHGRTQEKLGGAANNTSPQGFGPGAGTTYVPPGQGSVTVSNQPNAGGFGGGGGFSPQSNQGGFGGGGFSPQPSQGGFGGGGGGFSGGFNAPVTGQVAAGFGGKMGPVPGQDPIL